MEDQIRKITSIPSYTDFKSLPKADRIEMLKLLRREFEDKDIRETWKMKPAGYYQIVYRYGLGRGTEGKEPKGTMGRPKKNKEQKTPPVVETQGRTVIEAEYVLVPENAHENAHDFTNPYAAFNTGKGENPAVDLPFPTIKGTPAQLRKQFEAVAMFLEAHETEDTRFEIRIFATKA